MQTFPLSSACPFYDAGSQNEKYMKRLGIILFGLALILAQPVAGQVEFNPKLAPQLGSTVTYEFLGTEGGYGATGPYVADLPFGGAVSKVNIYCVDLGRRIWSGTIVNADVVNLAGPASAFTAARAPAGNGLTGAALQTSYQKAAYLSFMMSQGSFLTSTALKTHWEGLHKAIWHFTSGRALTGDGSLGTDAYWVAQANAAFGGGGFAPGFNVGEWSLLATTSYERGGTVYKGETQFMLTQSVVPEPQTYILMGTGLIFLVFFGRRRLKEMGYA